VGRKQETTHTRAIERERDWESRSTRGGCRCGKNKSIYQILSSSNRRGANKGRPLYHAQKTQIRITKRVVALVRVVFFGRV